MNMNKKIMKFSSIYKKQILQLKVTFWFEAILSSSLVQIYQLNYYEGFRSSRSGFGPLRFGKWKQQRPNDHM